MSGYKRFEGKWLILPEAFWNELGSNWAEDIHGSGWEQKFTAVKIEKWYAATTKFGQRLMFKWEDKEKNFLQLWHVDEFEEQGRFFGMCLISVEPPCAIGGV
jgi:hypothetical protein